MQKVALTLTQLVSHRENKYQFYVFIGNIVNLSASFTCFVWIGVMALLFSLHLAFYIIRRWYFCLTPFKTFRKVSGGQVCFLLLTVGKRTTECSISHFFIWDIFTCFSQARFTNCFPTWRGTRRQNKANASREGMKGWVRRGEEW